MARPRDETRRARTLARATDYVLDQGLAGLSLRPLATALDTSPRMLLYDFGSKERLIAEILAEARRREAALLVDERTAVGATEAETLRFVWGWIAAEERRPFLRLFFEVYVDAVVHPDKYPGGAAAMVADWIDAVRDVWPRRHVDEALATLLVTVVRGLLLDLLATEDAPRTSDALERFVALLAADDG